MTKVEGVYRIRKWGVFTLYTGGLHTRFILRAGRFTIMLGRKK